jgi:hypothetical protein
MPVVSEMAVRKALADYDVIDILSVFVLYAAQI